jgi:tryptophan synthase beta chain
MGRAQYEKAGDAEVLDALQMLASREGIIPALETAHALAWVIREAGGRIPHGSTVLVNLSGRGDKDVAQVREILRGES